MKKSETKPLKKYRKTRRTLFLFTMKKYLVLLLAVSFCAPLFAESEKDDKPVRKTAAERKKEELEKYDKDGDGKLDAEEKKAKREDEKEAKEKERKSKKSGGMMPS